MESRIEELMEKYWAGETSIEEERQIKAYFKANPSLTNEGKYFRALSGKQQVVAGKSFAHPGKSKRKAQWSAAAVITVGIMAALLVFQDARTQREFVVEDPQEAYEITRKALLMVSSGLNEGKSYSKELTKINKAQEIIKEQHDAGSKK